MHFSKSQDIRIQNILEYVSSRVVERILKDFKISQQQKIPQTTGRLKMKGIIIFYLRMRTMGYSKHINPISTCTGNGKLAFI